MYSFYPLYFVLLVFFMKSSSFVNAINDCNEFVCGSIVSKCLIMQSCLTKEAKCKECFHCLGELYLDCCGCVEMCPKHNETFSSDLLPKSSVGDFEGFPEYFEFLTAADEGDDTWTTLRFPMRASLNLKYSGYDEIARLAATQKMTSKSINCTLIYVNECMTNPKCSEFCRSMGASSFRWFHDGCCECVGANCFNYGINESHCVTCTGIEEDEEDDDSIWDYNEDEMNYN